eukprot:6191309-Pleurochrysis_carterae.AAC.1
MKRYALRIRSKRFIQGQYITTTKGKVHQTYADREVKSVKLHLRATGGPLLVLSTALAVSFKLVASTGCNESRLRQPWHCSLLLSETLK